MENNKDVVHLLMIFLTYEQLADMRKGADTQTLSAEVLWIAEISGMTQLILSVSAGESGNYYGISIFLIKMCL